jgi:hypothetical protein
MLFLTGIACAAKILRRGQEKGEGRSGTTDEPFDEPTAQKIAALRVAVRRATAVSPGSTDGPASFFAWLLADRHAGRQLRLFPVKKNMLKARLRS